jgi:chromate reductase, NAD(P)H dehydrogenase (quinone)
VPKILAFSGSERKESYNQKLVKIAASGAVQAGAEVTVINLADYPMPVFSQDLEAKQGMPETAREFKQLLIDHDGFLIASPEYNSAFSPLLKNVIDWASRKESDSEPPLAAFRGKVAVIMATSPGILGGIRGLVFLRMLLSNLGMTVLPNQQAVAQAAQVFDADGVLVDREKQATIVNLGRDLAITLEKLQR